MRPPDWKSAIEIHPAGWICPEQEFWIAGWVTSSMGLVPVDVRAWLGPVPFLGLCGLPRPDKETEARGRPGAPCAGFSFLLTPVPGASQLRIEVCDQHGRWTEIFLHAVTCPGKPGALPALSPDTQPLLRLLQAHHVRPNESWHSLADEILAAERARTFDVMPSFPFQGALEEINDRAAVHYDHLLLTGWVAHREQRILSLTAYLDTATPLPLLHGLSRPDASELFPELVDGARARFAGFLKIPPTAPRPLALRIFAELADGRLELVFLKRFRPVLITGHGTDLPPFSTWKLARAAWALRQAGWSEGWADGQFRHILRVARYEYRNGAPSGSESPASPPVSFPKVSRPLRVTIVTHNLNIEGAPLFVLEFARHLSRQPDWQVEIVSAQEGPLHQAFMSAGIAVRVVDASALARAETDEQFDTALASLAGSFPWMNADIVVANTLVAFWTVHLAHRLRKPCLYYVHESANVRRFFALQLTRPAIARVEKAFAVATRVVFVAAAAQRQHVAHAPKSNFQVLPGWIDVGRIRAYEASHDRTAQRRALDLPENAVVFAHIGSFLPRKGQHVFLAAISALIPRVPAAPPLIFLLVGGKSGPDPYADIIRDQAARQPDADIRLVDQTADAYRYFQAADIFVCSSLEEALPRVVMEAAAFGRSIVSTDTDGIPEILGPEEAWFAPPDDASRLAGAMQAALESHRRGDHRRAERARKRVMAHFDSTVLLPKHADLVRAVSELPLH